MGKGKQVYINGFIGAIRERKKDVFRRDWHGRRLKHLEPGKRLALWSCPPAAGDSEYICSVIVKGITVEGPHKLHLEDEYREREMKRMGLPDMSATDYVSEFLHGEWFKRLHRVSFNYESAQKRGEAIEDEGYWTERFRDWLNWGQMNFTDDTKHWFERSSEEDLTDLAMEWKCNYLGRNK